MIKREQLLLYAVTDRKWAVQQTLYEQVEQALLGGVTCVQLREKQMEQSAFLGEAIKMSKLCHAHGVPLIVNDNLKVALESGADGVHLGQGDGSVAMARERTGVDFIIGATAKTVEQARRAEAEGADYLGVGAVFGSPTKQNAIRITMETLRQICGAVAIPAVAIGGIGSKNMDALAGCGMAGVALVSAVFGAKDIQAAAIDLNQKARQLIRA